jgi:RimJ/RimL family protein N-acetyltransferase
VARLVTTVLETRRTRLREFTEADLDVVAALMADEEQMSLYPRPRTRDESKDWLRRNLRLYKERGFGFWLMEGLPSSDFLGYCGIRPGWWQTSADLPTQDVDGGVSSEALGEIEMGWHTKKIFWSQGIATEAATACRDLAFSRFEIPRLVATIDPTNAPSIRVAEKIGMQLVKEAVLDWWRCLIYSVERPPQHPTRG